MSLGSSVNLDRLPEPNDYARVIDALESVGITVVAASGNSFALFNEAGQSHPAVFSTLGVGNSLPADLELVGGGQPGDPLIGLDISPTADTFSVTSQRSTLSNQVVAPGAEIVSTYNNGDYTSLSGTSMASPMVAGLVALMQDTAVTFGGKYLTPAEVTSIIRSTADTIVDRPDPETFRVHLDANGQPIWPRLPNGQIDFSQLQDLLETGQSFLRVDARRAMQAVRDLVTQSSGDQAGSDTNNTIQTAVALPPLNGTADFRFEGHVGQDGQVEVGDNDVDLFQLVLETPGVLDILTEPIAGGSDFDPILRLFDGDGNTLGVNDDFNELYPALQSATLPAGTYYIGLSSFSNFNYDVVNGSGSANGESSGDYRVIVTTTNPDPNGVIQGAAAIDLTSPNFVWPADSPPAVAGSDGRIARPTGSGLIAAYPPLTDNALNY